jgi:hypothetical protein
MDDKEKIIYEDNLLDRLFIALFSRKIAKALGKSSHLKGYDGFVDLSNQIAQGRTSQQQQELVGIVLKSLVPSPVLYLIRTLFSPTKWVCESNAWFASVLFEWLVGVCELREVEVTDQDNQLRTQKSCVYIKKCRYLENSGCVGMCVNICKIPTQDFFRQSFGIPVRMTPNFDDFSCEMVFGQAPKPLEEDEAYNQPCLQDECPTARPQANYCPQLRSYKTSNTA